MHVWEKSVHHQFSSRESERVSGANNCNRWILQIQLLMCCTQMIAASYLVTHDCQIMHIRVEWVFSKFQGFQVFHSRSRSYIAMCLPKMAIFHLNTSQVVHPNFSRRFAPNSQVVHHLRSKRHYLKLSSTWYWTRSITVWIHWEGAKEIMARKSPI